MYHSIILMSFCYFDAISFTQRSFMSFESEPKSLICVSFNHLNVIQSFECHSVIWMQFHSSKDHSCHLNLIPSFYCHHIIPSSFRYKNLICVSFHHLNVIQSFECHSVIWMSFCHLDAISFIQRPFMSFESHSIISLPSHHS